MPTLGTNKLTASELIRREMPDGSLADRIDLLATSQELLNYLTWIPCNNGNSHEDKQVVARPTPAERAYNQGFPIGASRTQTVTEPTCMLGLFTEVDAIQLAQQSPGGNAAGVLAQEEQTTLGSIVSTLFNRLFNGDRGTYPLEINGLVKRSYWKTLAQTYTVGNGTRKYIYDNAAGNCAAGSVHSSIWIIRPGPRSFSLIYPQFGRQSGSAGNAPVKRTTYPEHLINDPNDSSKRIPVIDVLQEMDFGLFIHDPREIKRICNIYMSTSPDGSTKVEFNEEVLMEATNEMSERTGAFIAVSRAMRFAMRKRANRSGSLWVAQIEGEGPWAKEVLRFDGMPIIPVDELSNTEAYVT